MSDATTANRQASVGITPETLRARAQRRRETAERLWDERLERLLLEEADELERRAAAMELDLAIRAEEESGKQRGAQRDLAALRELPKARQAR